MRRKTCAGTNTDTCRRDQEQETRANSPTQQLFHRNLGLQTAQSVSGEPNKQFSQALKLKGGGPVVPLPPRYFHSTAPKMSQKPQAPGRMENTSSGLSRSFIAVPLLFSFARAFKKETSAKCSASAAFKNPFMRLPPNQLREMCSAASVETHQTWI